MFYTVRAPWLLKKYYASLVWERSTKEKILYLTFDDGPHPTATSFVLEHLKRFEAKATFFCTGKNVAARNDIYQSILDGGHTVGNHTFDHLNGWKTENKTYFENIFEAAKYIDSNLFRPPYGRITKLQSRLLKQLKLNCSNADHHFKIIMWTILSGDFDSTISPERCLQNVLLNARPGSIIVFHDSTKAWERMSFALPKVLEHFSAKGYSFESLS